MRYIVAIVLLVCCIFWFAMVMIDSLVHDSGSYQELSVFGKISSGAFMVSLGGIVVITLLMPLASLIYNKMATEFWMKQKVRLTQMVMVLLIT